MNIADVRELGTLSLLNYARKHASLCAAHTNDAVKGCAPPVETAAAELESAYGASRPLRALWASATRTKDRADDALDEVIAALSYELLGPKHLNRDRDASDYRVLFPDGNIRFIHGADRAQVAHVRGMVRYLKANPSHPMASRAAELDEKVEALDAALGPQTAAESSYRAAQTLEADRRATLVRALRKSAAILRSELDGGEAAVDRLFPKIAEARVDERDGAPADRPEM